MRKIDLDEASLGTVEGEIVVAVTREELATVAGAINEALEAVEDWEFHTRLGVSREQARQLLADVGEVLRATRSA